MVFRRQGFITFSNYSSGTKESTYMQDRESAEWRFYLSGTVCDDRERANCIKVRKRERYRKRESCEFFRSFVLKV